MAEEKELPSAIIVKTSLKQVKNGNALQEAKKLLGDAIEKLELAVNKIYKGDAVFAVVTVKQHSRAKRDAEQAPKAVSFP